MHLFKFLGFSKKPVPETEGERKAREAREAYVAARDLLRETIEKRKTITYVRRKLITADDLVNVASEKIKIGIVK